MTVEDLVARSVRDGWAVKVLGTGELTVRSLPTSRSTLVTSAEAKLLLPAVLSRPAEW